MRTLGPDESILSGHEIWKCQHTVIQVGTIQWLSLSLSLFWPLSMCDEVCQALRRCGRKRMEEEGSLSVVLVLTVTLGIRDASKFWHHVLRKRSARPSTRQVQVEVKRKGLNTICLSTRWPKSRKQGGIQLNTCSDSWTSPETRQEAKVVLISCCRVVSWRVI